MPPYRVATLPPHLAHERHRSPVRVVVGVVLFVLVALWALMMPAPRPVAESRPAPTRANEDGRTMTAGRR